MVATTWRDTSIRPRSLAWISVLGGFPVRCGLAFVFESIVCYYVTLISPQSYAMIREAPKQENHGTTLRNLWKRAHVRASRESLESAHEASLHAQSAQGQGHNRRPVADGPSLHPLPAHPGQ